MPSSQAGTQSEGESLALADKQVVDKVRDILTCMANAVSAMKIFPSDHATVRNFVDALSQKFDDYFKTYQRLQIGVEEYSFTCAGQVVFTDEMTIKSLPFFFFKDGTQILYFYRGLERQEIQAFLELIKIVAQKPGEENDIVAALWESDFSNIQYYAPDEFLENQILAEKRDVRSEQDLPELPSDLAHETLEVKVDLAKFSEGRIELKREDWEKFHWGPERCRLDEETAAGGPVPSIQGGPSPDESEGMAISPAASMEPNLSDSELEELESMVKANRLLWPEEEFINLTAEIVFLETDLEICAATLDILFDFHLDQISKGNFPVASVNIRKVQELKTYLEPDAPEKTALLESTIGKLTGPKALEAVKSLLGTKLPIEWPALLEFFGLIGPATLPTAAGLFEDTRDEDIRTRILTFIRQQGGYDPTLIVSLANDARPVLSLEIIRLLIAMPDQRGIPHLGAYLMFKNRDIKLEVIHALGGIQNEMANRILMGFLNDPDEDLRIQAAMKLNPTEETSRILHIIHEASSANFKKKSLREKQAVLAFLGRTRSKEALEFLVAVLGKTTWWPSPPNTEMRLAAVAGLESMGTAESGAALEEGTRAPGKKVRQACAEALARTHAPHPLRT